MRERRNHQYTAGGIKRKKINTMSNTRYTSSDNSKLPTAIAIVISQCCVLSFMHLLSALRFCPAIITSKYRGMWARAALLRLWSLSPVATPLRVVLPISAFSCYRLILQISYTTPHLAKDSRKCSAELPRGAETPPRAKTEATYYSP